MQIIGYVILTMVLLALSAGFSCSETALVSLSHYRLKKLMLKKKLLAGMFNQWLHAPHYILTTLLIGNNIVNLAITTISTAVALSIFSNIDQRIIEGGVWIFLIFIILIFGEITPKILGRRYPEAISLLVIRPLFMASSMLKPFINVGTKIIKPLSFGVRISPVKDIARVNVEEIKRLIKESGEGGYLGKTSTGMMQKVLMVDEISVGSIMVKLKNVESIDIDRIKDKKLDFIDEINEIGHSRIPVVKTENTNIVGYINVKDIYIPMVKGALLNIDEFIRQPIYVRKSDKVSYLLKEFKSRGVLIAIVKDEHNKACGIVTITDVLEEIVGGILEEYSSEDSKEI